MTDPHIFDLPKWMMVGVLIVLWATTRVLTRWAELRKP